MNRKIAAIKMDLENKKAQGHRQKAVVDPNFFVEKEGSAQIAVVGMTNVGKSWPNDCYNKLKSYCYTYTFQHA